MSDFLIAASDWLEIHVGLAAWAQAAGTTAGMAVAVLLPWRLRMQERALQRQALAAAVIGELTELGERARRAAVILDEAIATISPTAPRVVAEPDGVLVADLSLPALPVTAASPHQMHLLGRAGADVQAAQWGAHRFTAAVREEAGRWGSLDPYEFADRLAAVERLIEKAWTRVDHVRQGRIL